MSLSSSAVQRGPSIPGDVRPHVFAQLAWPISSAANGEADPGPAALPDVEALEAEAWNEGFHRGYEEGLRIAAEQQQTRVEALAQLVENASADAGRLVRALEQEVVELSLAVAEKVIEREARADPALVLEVIRAALAEIEDETVARVRVNPDDFELVQGRWDEAIARHGGVAAQRAELLPDELVETGGCVVETRVGRVDAQLHAKLAQISTTFHALLDGEPL